MNHRSPLALQVLQQFRVIFGSLRQHFRQVEQICGMSGSRMWVLQEVQSRPGIAVGELARRMGIHQSTCSLLVDRLVAQDCLRKQRGPGDQRRVRLFLAKSGETALAALPGPAEGNLPVALAMLPDVALKTLIVNLSEVIARLPDKDVSCAGIPLAELMGGEEEVLQQREDLP